MNQIEQTELLMSLDAVNEKLASVMRTKEWNALTPQQRNWVRNVVATNGDFLTATLMSYNCKSDANARTIAAQNKSKDAVRAVLDLCFPQVERDERKEFFAKLQRRILKGSITIAQLEGARMVARERGWTVPENLPATNGYVPVAQRSPKHFIGEAIRQNGSPFKVTEVDETGEKILDAADISEEEYTALSREQSEKSNVR